MSKSNKHGSHKETNYSAEYIKESLGTSCKCPRRQCHGTMVPVLVRYEKNGPINNEFECCTCGKEIKDIRFKAQREKRWLARKNKQQSNRTPYARK